MTPTEMRQIWEERDARYANLRQFEHLTERDIAIIRGFRTAEVHRLIDDLDSRARLLIEVTRWTPPPHGR